MGVKQTMFWRMVTQSLRLRWQQSLMIFSALTVGAIMVSAMSALYFDIYNKMSHEWRTLGANLSINSEAVIDTSSLQNAIETAPKGLVQAASAYLYGITRSEQENIVLMGVQFSQMRVLAPYWQINGESIEVDFDDRNVLIGKTLAEHLETEIGDTIILHKENEQKELKIKGIVETGEAADNMLISNLDFAQAWLDKPHQANYAFLNIDNQHLQKDTFIQKLAHENPEWRIQPILKMSHAEGEIIEKIKGLIGVVCVIVLLLVSLCVNNTLMAIIGERSKEFALQKSLGAQNRDIISQIAMEICLIALIAAITGIALGYIVAQILGIAVFKTGIGIRLPVFLITAIAVFLLAMIATIFPVKRALNAHTASILKGE